MSGITTKGVKTGDFISKELKPGNFVAKINSIKITKSDKPKYEDRADWTITLTLEGKPMGDGFVGFEKVFGQPEHGFLLGQSASVKTSTWPIRTFTRKSDNVEVSDVDQVLSFIAKLSKVFDINWLDRDDVNGKYSTLEELIAGFNKETFFKSKWMKWCVGATETKNDKGYTKYYMYLPERKDCEIAFALENQPVTTFDPEKHIFKSNSVTASASLNNADDLIDQSVDDLLDDDDLFEMED